MWKRMRQKGAISLDAPGNEALRKKLAHPRPTPLEDWERQRRRQAVEEILGLLPESQRLPAVLYYMDGFSQREIGDALDLPLSTIKIRLHRAKNRLRKKEAVDMAEKQFGKRDATEVELDLQFKQGAGFFHGIKEGWGFLRPSFDADSTPDDLYVSPSQRRMLNLIQGDYLHVTARPPKGDEHYWAVIRIEQINFRPLVIPVSGYLHLSEKGFGFLRFEVGVPAAVDDVYVSPQQVGDLDLKEGDFVEGVTYSRRQSRLSVNRVNHQPVREPVSPESLEVDGEFLRSGLGEQVVKRAREEAARPAAVRSSYAGGRRDGLRTDGYRASAAGTGQRRSRRGRTDFAGVWCQLHCGAQTAQNGFDGLTGTSATAPAPKPPGPSGHDDVDRPTPS